SAVNASLLVKSFFFNMVFQLLSCTVVSTCMIAMEFVLVAFVINVRLFYEKFNMSDGYNAMWPVRLLTPNNDHLYFLHAFLCLSSTIYTGMWWSAHSWLTLIKKFTYVK
ncbi:hypothetical protein L9F63_025788, partial [Diploptera punctata]